MSRDRSREVAAAAGKNGGMVARNGAGNVEVGIVSRAPATRKALRNGVKSARQAYALIEAIMRDYIAGELTHRDAVMLRDMLKVKVAFIRADTYGRWGHAEVPALEGPEIVEAEVQ